MEKPKKNNWPLNLIWTVGRYVENEDVAIKNFADNNHLNGIHYAISMLPKRMREMVTLYYRYNTTITNIAIIHNTSAVQTKTIIRAAIRHLSHPPYRDYLFYGFNSANKIYSMRDAENGSTAKKKLPFDGHNTTKKSLQNISSIKYPKDIRELGIPTRAINAIVRYISWNYCDHCKNFNEAKCYSTENLIYLIQNGELMKPPKLGKKTAEEVLMRIYELTGEDYFEIYGM